MLLLLLLLKVQITLRLGEQITVVMYMHKQLLYIDGDVGYFNNSLR